MWNDLTYGNQASLSFIADQLTEAGKTAAENEELQAEVHKLNALHPVKIDSRWSNPKPTEKRLPCYRAAHLTYEMKSRQKVKEPHKLRDKRHGLRLC